MKPPSHGRFKYALLSVGASAPYPSFSNCCHLLTAGSGISSLGTAIKDGKSGDKYPSKTNLGHES